MTALPDRPKLEDLDNQARWLLRRATEGDWRSVTSLNAVPGGLVLSTAQLAIARQYGFPTWSALVDEVERRRAAPHHAAVRQSFAADAPLETNSGVLMIDALVLTPDRAIFDAYITQPDHIRPEYRIPGFGDVNPPRQLDDVTIVDDRGTTYTLWLTHIWLIANESGPGLRPAPATLELEPVPEPGATWFDLRHDGGTVTRLAAATAPGGVRVGEVRPWTAEHEVRLQAHGLLLYRLSGHPIQRDYQVAEYRKYLRGKQPTKRDRKAPDTYRQLTDQLRRLCDTVAGDGPATGLPPEWAGMLDAADRTDGPPHHLDLGVVLPELDGVVTRLDTLISGPDHWWLSLRGWPGWTINWEEGIRALTPLSMGTAADDLGGMYLSRFRSSRKFDDHDDHFFSFHPRIDPRARTLTLMVHSKDQQVAVSIDLPSAVSAPTDQPG